MAVVTMQKVAVLGHQHLKEEVLELLHTEGVLEVHDAGPTQAVDHSVVEFRAADLQFAITTLKDAANKETLAATQKKASAEEVIAIANKTDVRGIVDTLRELEQQDTAAQGEIQEAQGTLSLLEPWLNLPYSLDASAASATSTHLLGTIPSPQLPALHDLLSSTLKRSTLEEIGQQEGLTYCSLIVWNEELRTFEEQATALGWSTVALPELAGTPKALCEAATLQIKSAQQTRDKNAKQREQLSVELPHLLHTQTFMHWLDDKQSVREAMQETSETFTVYGWMPKKKVELLESRLHKLSNAVAILEVEPHEGEEAPVLLTNSKLVTPFQSVTSLYGLPLSHEGDPTQALSPFFIVYFALCLTDAGYGLILALIFGIVCMKAKKTVEEAPLLWCLFFSGIMAFLVGIPFGGWFGLQPQQMPEWLGFIVKDGGTLFRGQLINLNDQAGVEFLQNLALILGLTHLFFGMYLAGAHKWKHGQKAAALWEDFTSHLLLAAAIFVAIAPAELQSVSTPVLYAAVALAIWGKGYGSPWFLRPVVGLLGLVNFALGLLSNGLSYLRILALGLVTGALAMAVNQVAVELGKLFPPFIAIPVIIIIFLLGHIVSIALNVLGSFIHSARLQFIEFFSQFFEGGGRGFQPFRRSTS